MTISIDWPNKIITVEKTDMTLIQSSPVEIYSLDLNLFRLTLRDLEDEEDGISYLPTHTHVAPVDVGGVTLARVVEIINDYTVTFEDGQYAVNLIGANSNLGDRVNVNNVSVRSANSAGLVTSAAIEYGEYGGAVTVDPVNGVSGSVYPIGTLRMPCNNVPDAMVIAQARGFNTLVFLKDIILGAGDDVTSMLLTGINPVLTTITIEDAAITDNCSIKHCTLQGILDNNTIVEKSIVKDVLYFNGEMRNCTLQGTVLLGQGASAIIVDCVAGILEEGSPIIDLGSDGQSLSVRNYNGELSIKNKVGLDSCSINMNAGHLILDSTIMAGDIYVEGTAKITDNSDGTAVVHMDSVQVAESAYNELVFVDTAIGVSGQNYPYGISTRPVNSITDALAIANTYNLKGLSLSGTIVADRDFENMRLEGRGVVTNNIIIASGFSFDNSNLVRLTAVGEILGNIFAENCIFSNAVGINGILIDCVLSGTFYINGVLQSRNTTLASHPTVIGFENNPASILQVDINAGALRVTGMTAASIAYIKIDSGEVTLDSSCTGGLVAISGSAKIIDNSSGVTIIDNTEVSEIADRVWDEARDDHSTEDTFGAVDEWAGTGTAVVDPEEVASAVWNAQAADYVTSSSFGGRVNNLYSNFDIIKKIETGRWKIVDNQMIFYNNDGVTPLLTFNLFDLNGIPTNTNVMERVPV